MNLFDSSILHFVNGFASRSHCLDSFFIFLNYDGFQKGGVVMILFWWAWFLPGKNIQEQREKLFYTMLTSPFALGVSRMISFAAPFRVRPIDVPELNVRLPYGLDSQTLIHWNSFPSDHAVLFFTFATGLFLVSRKLGTIALAYVTIFIAMPRIYLGVHYPTDILAGAVLGVAAACVAVNVLAGKSLWIGARALQWMESKPGAFYASMFFCSYQVANSFGWARDVVVYAQHTVRVIIFRG